jgi:leucyl aminopeptidase (aminopeptidase T)
LRHGDVLGPDQVGIDELVRVIDGVAVFAHAASSVALDVQPDDADAAALAAAHDRATELSARAEELSHRAGSLLVRAEIARLEHAGAGNGSARLVAEAEEAANRAQRTYLDARTRAEEAWRIVHEIDPTAATDEVDPQLWVRSDGP